MTTGERMRARRKEIGVSVDKIAAALNVSVATVYRYENGEIEKLPGAVLEPLAQVLRTTPAYLMGWEEQSDGSIPPGFDPLPETEKVPLLGSIACGEPILAEENIEDYIDAPKGKRIDFCLRCRGDSMADAGICDGDIVYIHAQPDVENGQIAAVLIENEATLKRVYKYPDRVILQPENRSYAPITYVAGEMNNLRIEGCVIGWVHWLEK